MPISHRRVKQVFTFAANAAAVESDPFPTPATGQLAMTVFRTRGRNFGPNTKLRLIFEAEANATPYRTEFAVLGAAIQRENDQWGRPLAIE